MSCDNHLRERFSDETRYEPECAGYASRPSQSRSPINSRAASGCPTCPAVSGIVCSTISRTLSSPHSPKSSTGHHAGAASSGVAVTLASARSASRRYAASTAAAGASAGIRQSPGSSSGAAAAYESPTTTARTPKRSARHGAQSSPGSFTRKAERLPRVLVARPLQDSEGMLALVTQPRQQRRRLRIDHVATLCLLRTLLSPRGGGTGSRCGGGHST